MTDRQTMHVRWIGQIDDDLYEEWITYPDKHDFVLHKDEATYAYKPGWHRSGWIGTAEDLAQLRSKPA